jgi:septin 7
MADSQSNPDSQNGYGNGTASPPAPALSGAIRKKLMGYVGFSNLPNQVHRRSVRKGFNFTAMVVGWFILLPSLFFALPPTLLLPAGESGLGKSTLINTLFNTTLYPGKQPLPPSAERPQTVAIESISAGESLT